MDSGDYPMPSPFTRNPHQVHNYRLYVVCCILSIDYGVLRTDIPFVHNSVRPSRVDLPFWWRWVPLWRF